MRDTPGVTLRVTPGFTPRVEPSTLQSVVTETLAPPVAHTGLCSVEVATQLDRGRHLGREAVHPSPPPPPLESGWRSGREEWQKSGLGRAWYRGTCV